MTPAGVVMVMLSPEEFRRTIADVVAAQLQAQRESSAPEPISASATNHDADPLGLTTAQAMKHLGYSDYKCFKVAVRRLGITPYRPSPRKTYYAPEEIAAALERDRAKGPHRSHYTRIR